MKIQDRLDPETLRLLRETLKMHDPDFIEQWGLEERGAPETFVPNSDFSIAQSGQQSFRKGVDDDD